MGLPVSGFKQQVWMLAQLIKLVIYPAGRVFLGWAGG